MIGKKDYDERFLVGDYGMSDDFFSNLQAVTSNIEDITFSRFATITSITGNYATVKEDESELEHTNVPLLNGVNLRVGDKVVLGFVDNSIYNPIALGGIGQKSVYTKAEVDKIVEDIISGDIDLKDYMKWSDYTADLGNQTETSKFLQALDNTIISITGRGYL